MAEYMTHEDAKCKFASKSKGNAALTLGIIGTAMSALGNGGIGNILGGNSNRTEGPTAYEVLQKESADNVELTRAIYDGRITDLNEKFEMYKLLDDKINALAIKEAQTQSTLPLAFELAKVNAERYADNSIYSASKHQCDVNFMFQRELDKKINGTIGLPWSDIISGIPTMPACTMAVSCPCA